MIDESHISRLMKLGKALGTGDGLTLMQIRTKFKASRRTAYRDMTALEQLGINVVRKKKQYTIKMKPVDCRRHIRDTVVAKIDAALARGLR